jgi:Cu2+-exporting ATPase
MMQVFQKRRGRACIVGALKDSAEAQALEAWLAERIDVICFAQRAGTGAFYVDYDDGAALPGRFIRSVRDAIHRIEHPPRSFEFEPVHSLRGRVRLRVTGVPERELGTLAMLTGGLRGVRRTEHLPGSQTMLVLYDPAQVSEGLILESLRASDPADWTREWHRPAPIRWLGAVSGTSVLFMSITGAAPFPLLAAGIVFNTLTPLRRSIEALRRGEISIDLLDVAATLAALVTGRPVTAAFVIWMVGVGDFLLDVSANKARSALSMLMQRGEREAVRVLPDDRTETVPIGHLEVGDHFIVYTGQSIVADGTVVSGAAEVDEKALTGESQLLSRKRGDRVFASTVIVEGHLVIEVESAGKNTEAARIERILNTVGSKPLTLQRDALTFASRLVLPTFGVAALAGILGSDVTRTICVLITDFGTGIRIAVPTSALTAMALAAREGVLVRGAQYLERLAKTDVIVFDKTGTLTNGVPEVVEVVAKHGMKKSTLIQLCASAEANYDHPVARALKSYAKERGIRLLQPERGSEEYTVGLGLSARVGRQRVRVGRVSWMESQDLAIDRAFQRHLARFKKNRMSSLSVAVGNEVVGLVAYSDGTRPESAAIVRSLRAGGRRSVVLLSGDSPEVAKSIARELGIDEAIGGLLPEDKADYIQKMRAAGCVVAMVGDGINDAPALASADVGISIAGSTDVAIETADVVLLDGGLARLEAAFRISDQTMSSVRQSLGLIILPNAVAIALGALGLIQPALAAIINNGATLVAVLAGTMPLLRAPLNPRAAEPTPVTHLAIEAPDSAPLLAAGLEGS